MAEQILKDIQLFYPELTLMVTLCVAIIGDLIFRRTPIVTSTIVMLGFVVTGVMVIGEAGIHASIFGNMVAVDSFAYFFKLVIIISAILIVVFSLGSSELNTGHRRLGEYYSLLVALTLGMMLMTGASNLLMMYLSLELSSISSYILSGYTREAPDSSEANVGHPSTRRSRES